MKVNFYIHGVPKGQDVWGSEQDRDYIKSFYSASYADSVRFVVEIIPAKKRAFYTYLRAKNVYGSENREGSYFGMTISLDGVYCTDNESLFALFDTIFNRRIIGSILQNNGGNLRFIVPALDGKSKELENLQSEFLKQLDSFAEDLEKINNTFTGSASGQIAYYHTSEVDSTNFFSILKQTLKVYISPEYATKDTQIASLKKQIEPEKAKNKQLSENKAELESQLSTATDKNKRYEAELTTLGADKQKLEDDNKKLRSENASLKTDLERNKAKNGIEKSVSQIKQPLEELLKGVRKLVPYSNYDEPQQYHYNKPNEQEPSKFDKMRSWVVDGIVIIIFILLLCIIYTMFFQTKWTKPIVTYKELATTTTVNKNIEKPYVVIKVDGGQVEPGKEYTAMLCNTPQGLKIKWRIDGAEVPNGIKDDEKITFKPLADKDSVHLTSCVIVNNNYSIIEKMKWPIKKQ